MIKTNNYHAFYYWSRKLGDRPSDIKNETIVDLDGWYNLCEFDRELSQQEIINYGLTFAYAVRH